MLAKSATQYHKWGIYCSIPVLFWHQVKSAYLCLYIIYFEQFILYHQSIWLITHY